jgi:NAD(P)H-nitrite reductase large subunit
MHEEGWYKQNNIINKLGVNVNKLNTAEKVVDFNDGTEIKYDKCIYALGSECFIPPFSVAINQE